ncbi:MAG: DUF2141 domain-containing protein [Gammaproteobacteria bacterium]
MSKTFSIIALIAWSALALAADVGYSGAKLHVTVENLKNDKGQVVIAIFSNKKDYLKKPVGEAAVAISEDLTSETEFGNLPAGTYAIAAYHDKNKNGDLDTLVVVPKEDYGFSNDARSLFGPPSFKKAAFEFNGSEDLYITIRAK